MTDQKQAANQSSDRMTAKEKYKRRREEMSQVDLSLVLERMGADPNQDGDRSKWKISGFGNIITDGQRWKNVNTQVHKGFGGVDLAFAVYNFDRDGEALRWMEQQFGPADQLDASIKATAGKERRKAEYFDPPQPQEHFWDRVRAYLVNERGIPGSLVDRMKEGGTLYASQAFDDIKKRYYGAPRAVFLGPSSAEVREIVKDGFKGCTFGSDPDSSFFHVPHVEEAEEGILAIQEAGVDALSYAALYPGRYCVSTNGVGRFPLQYRLVLEAQENGFKTRLAFDADNAGDLGAQHVFNGVFARILLSRRLEVSYETVDQWILSGAIDITPLPSPHLNFYSSGWKPALPVYDRKTETDPDGKIVDVWVPTSNTAPPTVHFNVKNGLHPKLNQRSYDIAVSERAFNYITQSLGLVRDRPVLGKDWNDELRKLGSSYLMRYEKEVRKNFENGVPMLPPHLEALRTSEAKIAPSPTPASFAPPKQEDDATPSRPSFQM